MGTCGLLRGRAGVWRLPLEHPRATNRGLEHLRATGGTGRLQGPGSGTVVLQQVAEGISGDQSESILYRICATGTPQSEMLRVDCRACGAACNAPYSQCLELRSGLMRGIAVHRGVLFLTCKLVLFETNPGYANSIYGNLTRQVDERDDKLVDEFGGRYADVDLDWLSEVV